MNYLWSNLFTNETKSTSQSNTSTNVINSNNNISSNVSNDLSAYAWLNNCLKWFYFSSETTKSININILETLNNIKTQIGQTLSLVYYYYYKNCIR
jgi:hypothetical protein